MTSVVWHCNEVTGRDADTKSARRPRRRAGVVSASRRALRTRVVTCPPSLVRASRPYPSRRPLTRQLERNADSSARREQKDITAADNVDFYGKIWYFCELCPWRT